MSIRGEIKHRNRARQINDFSGILLHRNITPSDIDLFIDLNGKAIIVGEGKLVGANLTIGQKIMIQNLCGGFNGPAIGIVWFHDEYNFENDVNVGQCAVSHVYFNGSWHDEKRTVIDVVSSFLKYCEKLGVSI